MEESNMKLVPSGDRVVLKQLDAEETTKSGIVRLQYLCVLFIIFIIDQYLIL